LWILVQSGDERLIDLDLVEGKGLPIAQGGIARSEIIHGDAHTERLEPGQNRNCPSEVIDEDAFDVRRVAKPALNPLGIADLADRYSG
jgi:hypothetical protein